MAFSDNVFYDGLPEGLECRPLSVQDAASASAFVRSVWEAMDRKDWFALDDDGYIGRLLSAGMACGLKVTDARSGAIAALLFVTFPGEGEDNLGRDVPLPDGELHRVAHMDIAAVGPSFRGLGLQHWLMSSASGSLAGAGYRYLMCTVHPHNRFSVSNIESLGYEFVKTAVKYGGLERRIYIKRI